jgi:two-component system, LytTR family, sensor kinase
VAQEVLIGITIAVIVVIPVVAIWRVLRARQGFATQSERAAYDVLHLANQAAPLFRRGLDSQAAEKAARPLRRLLGSAALSISDGESLLAWDGEGAHHGPKTLELARPVMSTGRVAVVGPPELRCDDPDCTIRAGIIVPIVIDDGVAGTLGAFGGSVGAGTMRAATEVAQWVAVQLELGELDRSQARAAEAEVRALRAQISPHFIYNALTTIAAHVRSDPDHARELLLQFADFTRYSFRSQGQFTTLAAELHSIDAYLMLERARFGRRLSVTWQVAPEVLPVVVPYLVLQPLVENAVRHGIEDKRGPGQVSIVAKDAGTEALITVEDDGVGMDPDLLRRLLAGEDGGDSVGLANVDERLRTVYGPEFGLVVETGPQSGTKVTVRVPKYRAGVRASAGGYMTGTEAGG